MLNETATTQVLELACWQWGLVQMGMVHDANYGRQPSPSCRDKPVAGFLAESKRAVLAMCMALCGPHPCARHTRHSLAPHGPWHNPLGMALFESVTMAVLTADPWPGRLAAQQDLTAFALLAQVSRVAQVGAVASAPLGSAPP